MVQAIEQYLETVGREQTKLPKRVDIANLLDVDDDTLVRWEKKYPDFYATIKRVDRLQESQLTDDGMYGGKEVNAAMAIFLLKANHGKSDGTGAVNVNIDNRKMYVALPNRSKIDDNEGRELLMDTSPQTSRSTKAA